MNVRNILFAGRTGAGKSSLINYIAGKKIAEVGVGLPVTSRDDVSSYSVNFRGVPIRMFDSWGIEADKVSDWKRRTVKMISDSGDKCESDAAWFHTVVYCIPAHGGRIEPIDTKMIKYFRDASFSVVVALTNADRATDSDMDELESALPRTVLKCRISSGGRTRFSQSKPFGKEELLGIIVLAALKNLPNRAEKYFKAQIVAWRQDMCDQLWDKDVGCVCNGDIERWIKSSSQTFASELTDVFKSFANAEMGAVVTWGRSVASEIPECGVVVSTIDDVEWGVGDYIGAAICAPLFPFVALGMWVFGSKDEERNKLLDKINDAARQMEEYVVDAVNKFAEKLPKVG